MPPGKLRMKRTPEEQTAHDLRKAQKGARKASTRASSSRTHSTSPPRPKKRRKRDDHGFVHPVSDFDDKPSHPYGPQRDQPGPSRHHREHKPDWDYIRAQEEEERFRDKLWGALDDDERLDGVEARLNSYAHIPRRWRSGGMDRMEDDMDIHPQYMEDEDYTEWIRVGMWRYVLLFNHVDDASKHLSLHFRRKHAAEHAEQVRIQAEREARLEKERTLRAETAKLQRAEEDERRRRKSAKQETRLRDARASYDVKWKALLNNAEDSDGPRKLLSFEDIPWPILNSPASSESLTAEAVLAFLLPSTFDHSNMTSNQETTTRLRKERLRETLLRFHPDKFEGRILQRVEAIHRERVKEAADKLVRVVNSLMAQA